MLSASSFYAEKNNMTSLHYAIAVFLGIVSFAKAQASESPPCAFCNPKIVAAQFVDETTHFNIILDHEPRVRGHLLIIPKRHVMKAHELSAEEWRELSPIINRIAAVFLKEFGIDQYIFWEKNGPKAFQTVLHVHFHVVPATAPTWGDIFNIQPRRLAPEELRSESLFFQRCFALEK